MDFSTSGLNCASYADEIVFDIAHEGFADLGKHQVGMIELLFIIILSSLKLLQVKDFPHYVF